MDEIHEQNQITDADGSFEVINRLRTQNEKLSTELASLSSTIDATLSKKELKPPVVNIATSEDPSDIKMKLAMGKIKKLQKEIKNLKFQLQSNDEQKYTDLNNDLSSLKSKLDDVNSENQSLVKVQQNQERAVAKLQAPSDLEEQCAVLEKEIKISKDQSRELKQKYLRININWKNEHTKMVLMEARIRNIEGKKKQDNFVQGEIDIAEKNFADVKKKFDVVEKANRTEVAKCRRERADAKARLIQLQGTHNPQEKQLEAVTNGIKEKEITIKDMKSQIRQLQLKQSKLAPDMKFKSKTQLDLRKIIEKDEEQRPASLLRERNNGRQATQSVMEEAVTPKQITRPNMNIRTNQLRHSVPTNNDTYDPSKNLALMLKKQPDSPTSNKRDLIHFSKFKTEDFGSDRQERNLQIQNWSKPQAENSFISKVEKSITMRSELEDDIPVQEVDMSEKIAQANEEISNTLKSLEGTVFSKPKLEF